MTVLIGLLNLTLTAAEPVLVLLAKERLHLGPVGYGMLFTCMAAGALLGSACGDWLIRRVTATWTIRVGLLIEAGQHLVLATSRARTWSASCCSRSACTERCGRSWAVRCGSG
jgi:hypothetical protein